MSDPSVRVPVALARTARSLALVTLSACATGTIDEFETCALELFLSPATAAVGDPVTIGGGPFTEVRDTRIEIGGVRAEITTVIRTDCDLCDDCLADAGCPPCGLCSGAALDPAERTSCFGDPLADPPVPSSCVACTESVEFIVPDLPNGATHVWMVNRNGASDNVPFEIVGAAPSDTGASTTTP